MEKIIYGWLIYTFFCSTIPFFSVVRARYLKHALVAQKPLFLFHTKLPPERRACAVWVYGARCVVVDTDWAMKCSNADLMHALRHEIGHFVLGHARRNALLCAAGLWFLVPLFRERSELEAELFAQTLEQVEP